MAEAGSWIRSPNGGRGEKTDNKEIRSDHVGAVSKEAVSFCTE